MAWALALGLTVLALVQALHKARQGQCALLKWRPQIEALERGEVIYGRQPGGTREGFPTLPTTALALGVFLELDDVAAAVLWAVFKLGLAWWMLAASMRMATGSVAKFPPWALVAVIALTARVLLSDVAHGNVNIPVAALVVATGLHWQRGNERAAGLLAGLAAVLKVTPALLVLYFAWKRGWRSLLYFGFGVALFGFALPMLVLGPSFHLELVGAWWKQMVEPFASGAELTLVQTEQTNQSLLGVLARWLTDSVAIRARPPLFPEDVSIHVLALSHGQFQLLFRVTALAVLAFAAWCTRVPRERRASAATLAEIAVVALVMLLVSERSWKQHYVTLCLPLAYLAWRVAARGWRDAPGRLALAALTASTALHGLSGSGLLGARASDLAEAYGAFFAGALALLVATGWCARLDPGSGPAK